MYGPLFAGCMRQREEESEPWVTNPYSGSAVEKHCSHGHVEADEAKKGERTSKDRFIEKISGKASVI